MNNLYGSGSVFKWSKEYLVKVLTTGKSPIVTDPLLINAFNQVDRKDFVPMNMGERAYEDVELEIGYGEKLNKPTIVGQMIAMLKPKYGGKYLDLGSGTGYAATLLGFIAGETGKVYSMERVQWLWEMARANTKKYPKINNIEYIYRDAKDGLAAKAPFDAIHISFIMENIPEELKMQLKVGTGIMVVPTKAMELKVITRKTIENFEEEIVPGFKLDGMKEGIA